MRNVPVRNTPVSIDLVMAVIRAHEQGEVVSPTVWFEAFSYAAFDSGDRNHSVLTRSTLQQHDVWVGKFVAAAPTVDQVSMETVSVELLAEVWQRLVRHFTGPLTQRLTNHLVLVHKLAELTGVFTDIPDHRVDDQKDLWQWVRRFYEQALMWKQYDVAFTGFEVQPVLYRNTLIHLAAHPMLPAEIIERYAFSVPGVVAEQFVAHPNCSARVRALLAVSLPQMST